MPKPSRKAANVSCRNARRWLPVEPVSVSPTFLLDFRVFPGNSGGPVFMSEADRRRPGADQSQEVQFIAGMLTQQVEQNDVRLEIGIVTDAEFIRETIAELDQPAAPRTDMPDVAPLSPPPAPTAIASRDAVANVGRAVGD